MQDHNKAIQDHCKLQKATHGHKRDLQVTSMISGTLGTQFCFGHGQGATNPQNPTVESS